MADYGLTFHIHDTDDPNRLRELLANPDGHLERAARQLLAKLGNQCKTVIEERDYVDRDFRGSYARFYYIRHLNTNRNCRRLNLFAGKVSPDDLFCMDSGVAQDRYLGFVVKRPLPALTLGRTVLAASLMPTVEERLGGRESIHVTCSASYSVNLAGNRIIFEGVPWIQQDGAVSRCAAAAIWVTNWHMSHRFPTDDFKQHTTSQITDLASKYSSATGRSVPSSGLTVDQMLFGMKSIGYEPIIRTPTSARAATHTCYHYVQSSVPVILVVTTAQHHGHALTLVGYTDDLTRPKFNFASACVASSGDFVRRFIVQDDSGGPFRFAEFLDWTELETRSIRPQRLDEIKSQHRCALLLDPTGNPKTDTENIAYLRSVLIPMPQRVTIDGNVTEARAAAFVDEWYKEYSITPPKQLFFRTFLQPSNNLKTWWDPREKDRPPTVAEELRRLPMPRWVWVTEFADLERVQAGEKDVLGQVIQDSASLGLDSMQFDFDVVAFVGPGRFQVSYPNTSFGTAPWSPVTRIAQYASRPGES